MSRYIPRSSSHFSLKILETLRAVPGGPCIASFMASTWIHWSISPWLSQHNVKNCLDSMEVVWSFFGPKPRLRPLCEELFAEWYPLSVSQAMKGTRRFYGIWKNHEKSQSKLALSFCMPSATRFDRNKKQLLRWWPSVARSRQCAKHSSAHCDQAPVASSLCTRQWRCRWKPPAQCKANDFMSARATCRKFSEKQTEEIIREFYGLGLR